MTFSCSDEFKVISSTESHPDFIGITVKEIKETLDWARNQLIVNSLNSQQLTGKLDYLENILIRLIHISTNYCFTNNPINGFSSFVDLVLQFFRHLYWTNYLSTVKSSDDLETSIDLLLSDMMLLDEFHRKQLESGENNNKPMSLFSDKHDVVRQFFSTHALDSNQTKTMIANFSGFWNNHVTRKYSDRIMFIYAFLYSPFPKCLRAFVDAKFNRLTCYRSQLTSLSLLLPQMIDTHTNRKLIIGLLNRDAQVFVKSFDFERQTQWTIASEGKNVHKSHNLTTDKCSLEFRFLQHTECNNSSQTLIFYGHGGGFVCTRSEFHEVYLKKFARELKDVPILCLDYSLRAPYPMVFQEFLDAYLWVTSGSPDVVDKIGFHPKKIIISGDSAGATICMALIHCLSQIEAKDPTITINYPSELVLFYGAFVCSALAFPSRGKLFYDEILGIGLLCNISGCLSNIQGTVMPKSQSTNSLIRVVDGTYQDLCNLVSIIRGKMDDTWFIKDGQFDVDRILKSQALIENTFYNALKDFNYNKFRQTKLTLLTTNRCCFLDDNVELAKAWKGPIEMHVILGAAHGFLFLPEEKKALQFAINLLKKAIDL